MNVSPGKVIPLALLWIGFTLAPASASEPGSTRKASLPTYEARTPARSLDASSFTRPEKVRPSVFDANLGAPRGRVLEAEAEASRRAQRGDSVKPKLRTYSQPPEPQGRLSEEEERRTVLPSYEKRPGGSQSRTSEFVRSRENNPDTDGRESELRARWVDDSPSR